MIWKPTPNRSYSLVQLVIAVFVMAMIIRVAFHEPAPTPPRTWANPTSGTNLKFQRDSKLGQHNALRTQVADKRLISQARLAMQQALPAAGQGPLLARAVFHASNQMPSARQIDGIVQTLPPGQHQSVIILPSVEKPACDWIDKHTHAHPQTDPGDTEHDEEHVDAGADGCESCSDSSD